MKKLTRCTVCQSSDLHPYLEVRDHFLTGESFSILTCRQCECGLTDPRPDPDELGNYYQSRAYISHSASSRGITNKVYLLARLRTLRKKYKLVRSFSKQAAGSILDVGCGSGEFLYFLKKRKWETRGIEIDETTRMGAMKKYQLQIGGSDLLKDLPDQSQHVVTFWHSLEHIADLHGTLNQVKRILRADGVLFIAVPNYTSQDAAEYGSHWAAWDVPRHLYHFTPITMDYLTGNHGMSIRHVIPMKLDAYYVSVLSERYRYGRVNYLRAFRNGWRSNQYARTHANTFSSLLYVIDPENA